MTNDIIGYLRKVIPIKFNYAERLGEGVDCIAYALDNELVAKIPKNNYAVEKLVNEAKVLKLLNERNFTITVPKLINTVITDNSEIPFISIVTKIKGQQLTRCVFNEIIGRDKDRIADDIALFMNELHSIDALHSDIKQVDMFSKYLSDFNKIRYQYYNEFNDEIFNILEDFYQKIFKFYTINKEKKSLIHGDFSLDMIFYDTDKRAISGIIDFGDSIITDTDLDFIYLLEDDEDYPRKFGENVLSRIHCPVNVELIDKKIMLDHIYWDIEMIFKGELTQNKEMITEGLHNLNKNTKCEEFKYFEI